MNSLSTLLASAAATAGAHGGPEAVGFPTDVLVGHDIPWLWLIPALPALGALVNLAFGARLQRAGKKHVTSHIAIGVMVAATILAWYVFLFRLLPLNGEQAYLFDHVWTMFTAGTLRADMAFALDPLSMVMVLVVTTVATAIHVYSVGYMAEDPKYWKFFVFLNYFVVSMLLLVMGDNFLLMFFGWEGVGLASYLLIGFWWEDIEKAKAGMKAFVVNRVGDFGFLIGLFILFWSLGGAFVGGAFVPDADRGALRLTPSAAAEAQAQYAPPTVAVNGQQVPVGPTLNFKDLRNQVVLQETGVAEHLKSLTLWGLPALFLVGLFFFIGAAGKSAQLPLYVWLPDAMAGPTPVSALIHAATMVTAGVYMVVRLNFIYALSPGAMTVVALVGGATALFAATIGLFQHDIKKVLAYSTVSQLGYMFVGAGIGAFWVAIYHLMNHAAFKATLFLGSGSVIHGCHHEQDMRKMGGLKKYMPSTRWTYVIATLAITGVPLANGFYSKDEILFLALDGQNLLVPGWVPWGLGFLGALGTAYYMWRSYFFTFEGEYRGAASGHSHSADDVTAVTHDATHAALDAETGHGAGAHGAHPDHATDDHHSAHGGLPHESPRTMTWVLWFLAALSVLTVFIGLPHAWGFTPLLETFLAPVTAGAAPLMAFDAVPTHHWIEYALQAIGGLAIPAFGFFVARYFYLGRGTKTRDRLADEKGWWTPVWQLVYNKYYVDELYDATVIRGVLALRTAADWFDRTIVDGLVNLIGWANRILFEIVGALDLVLVDGIVVGVGRTLMSAGRGLKRVQGQRIHAYLYTVLGGALVFVILNYVLF